MKNCPICGRASLKTWVEYDMDGQPEHQEECLNPNCGEESSDEDID